MSAALPQFRALAFSLAQWTYQQACPKFDTLQITWAWYNNEDLRWWMEATAAWAQRQAVQGDRSYIGYIRTYLSRPWQHMDSRLRQGDDGFSYSTLFPFYLIERIAAGNNAIIRNTWEEYQRNGNCGAMKPVIDTLLPQNQKIKDIFPDYTEANYFLAYASQAEFRTAPNFGLGMDYRPARDERHDLSDQNPSVIGPRSQYGGGTIQYLGAAYVEFRQSFTQRNMGRTLNIAVHIPVTNASIPPVVKVWIIGRNFPPPPNAAPAATPVTLVNYFGTWQGGVTIQNFDSDQIQWVTMAVINPQTGGSPLEWHYQGNAR